MTGAETERKKAFLRSYQRAKRGQVALMLELEELENALPAAGYDGQPHSHEPQDLSGKVARIVELKEKIRAETDGCLRAFALIENAVKRLGPGYEREVLTRRYLIGQSWEDIETEMHMSARNAQRYHGYALAQLVVPKGWKSEKVRRRDPAAPGGEAAAVCAGGADRERRDPAAAEAGRAGAHEGSAAPDQ